MRYAVRDMAQAYQTTELNLCKKQYDDKRWKFAKIEKNYLWRHELSFTIKGKWTGEDKKRKAS